MKQGSISRLTFHLQLTQGYQHPHMKPGCHKLALVLHWENRKTTETILNTRQ